MARQTAPVLPGSDGLVNITIMSSNRISLYYHWLFDKKSMPAYTKSWCAQKDVQKLDLIEGSYDEQRHSQWL
jgi:hypothetical protein